MTQHDELRFRVLEMAKDLCEREMDLRLSSFWQMYQQLETKVNTKLWSEAIVLLEALKELEPTPPTTQEIKEKAEDLYRFIIKQ